MTGCGIGSDPEAGAMCLASWASLILARNEARPWMCHPQLKFGDWTDTNGISPAQLSCQICRTSLAFSIAGERCCGNVQLKRAFVSVCSLLPIFQFQLGSKFNSSNSKIRKLDLEMSLDHNPPQKNMKKLCWPQVNLKALESNCCGQ